MVNKNPIIELGKEYIAFYSFIINESKSPGDVERATYGLQEARKLVDLVEKSKGNLTNTQLKDIHTIFTNMVRGVEYFQDDKTELKKRQLGSKLYFIKEAINSKIKW